MTIVGELACRRLDLLGLRDVGLHVAVASAVAEGPRNALSHLSLSLPINNAHNLTNVSIESCTDVLLAVLI